MTPERPLDHASNASLKARAQVVAAEVERAPADRHADLLAEVASLRDEMLHRLHEDGGEDPLSGVREPRTPLPGGGAAAVAVEPEAAS